jgi:hypothetical protein
MAVHSRKKPHRPKETAFIVTRKRHLASDLAFGNVVLFTTGRSIPDTWTKLAQHWSANSQPPIKTGELDDKWHLILDFKRVWRFL